MRRGSYDKWLAAGLDEDYLPHWIKKAGYKAEYVGKFLNGKLKWHLFVYLQGGKANARRRLGYNVVNCNSAPKGWDHVDALVSLRQSPDGRRHASSDELC